MERAEAVKLMRTAGWPEPWVEFFGKPQNFWAVFSGEDLRGRGPTLREALESAGVKVPPVTRFTSIKSTVVLGSDTVATCRSTTMARRIANALNQYEPNARGV